MGDPDAEKGDTTASTANFAKFLLKSQDNLAEITRFPPPRAIDSDLRRMKCLFKRAWQIYYLPS